MRLNTNKMRLNTSKIRLDINKVRLNMNKIRLNFVSDCLHNLKKIEKGFSKTQNSF